MNMIHLTITEALHAPDIVRRFVEERVASRLAASDPTLWGEAAAKRASTRLGWVDAIGRVGAVIERAEELRDALADIDYDRVFLCGMGGSSLAPQVMSIGSKIPLIAVDTMHPDRLDTLLRPSELNHALVIVSSKSGITGETRSQLSLIEHRMKQAGIDPQQRIIAITDPDSALAHHAQQQGYRLVLTDPTVGGRYSALIEFGIVPTILTGASLDRVADDALATLQQCALDDAGNPMLVVAAALAQRAPSDVTAQFVESGHPLLPEWLEQLIAESTGHEGQGLLPLPRTSDTITETAGPVINVTAPDTAPPIPDGDVTVQGSLAAQFVFWELVTATMSTVLGINPFEQPDVERTKEAARNLTRADIPESDHVTIAGGLAVLSTTNPLPSHDLIGLATRLIDASAHAKYVVIQAFLAEPPNDDLERIARTLEATTRTPVTVSYGPQYLHSTGQFHKGGPSGGFFMSVFEEPTVILEVPDTDTSFNWLAEAQSRADVQVLERLGRDTIAIRVSDERSLGDLVEALQTR